MVKKIFILVFLAILPITSFSGTMVIDDYPVMYFPNKEGVKLDIVQNIILDAVERSSYPKHIWTVDSDKPGEIIARLNVRTHTLRMKIKYDTHSINIQYHDSTRLSYSENGSGLRRIHDKYKPWSEFLVSKIKYVAKRETKMDFVDESPIKKIVLAKDGSVVQPTKMLYAAFGEAGKRASEAGIYSDAENSKYISKAIGKYLKKVKPDNVSLASKTWNSQLDTFIESRRNSILDSICKSENTDIILLGYLEEYIGGISGVRNMFYFTYFCKIGELTNESYETYDGYDDRFPYELEIVKNLRSYVRRYSPFKL